jgi:integrase
MTAYFVKGRGWRYDFLLNKTRYTETWFETKREAKKAEARKRQELKKPVIEETKIDMGFFELVNVRLDYIQVRCSKSHYRDCVYMAKRWVKEWGEMLCSEITKAMVEQFILQRAKVSHHVANREIRCLRATFNYGINREIISNNPVKGIEFLPVEKRKKRIPTPEELDKLIAVADSDTQDYLYVIRDTMARISEINRLVWDDIDLKNRTITLYTRKKKGGNFTPRMVPMTERLYEVLLRRFNEKDPDKPWVFWHEYWSRKAGKMVVGAYHYRKRLMSSLCEKAGVPSYGFHSMRHSGASVMDNNNVPIGAIQKILGHENRTTTEIYLHSIGNAEKEAISIFEKASKNNNSHTDSHK